MTGFGPGSDPVWWQCSSCWCRRLQEMCSSLSPQLSHCHCSHFLRLHSHCHSHFLLLLQHHHYHLSGNPIVAERCWHAQRLVDLGGWCGNREESYEISTLTKIFFYEKYLLLFYKSMGKCIFKYIQISSLKKTYTNIFSDCTDKVAYSDCFLFSLSECLILDLSLLIARTLPTDTKLNSW